MRLRKLMLIDIIFYVLLQCVFFFFCLTFYFVNGYLFAVISNVQIFFFFGFFFEYMNDIDFNVIF